MSAGAAGLGATSARHGRHPSCAPVRAHLVIAVAASLAACAPSVDAPRADAPRADAPLEPAGAYQLPTPSVVMQADPPPPFTYWAPDGATIVNHPNVPGLWLAEVAGRNVKTYYGDECRASELQQFVGEPQQSFMAPSDDVEVRLSCVSCPVNSDLRANRVNVLFDEESQLIAEIACY